MDIKDHADEMFNELSANWRSWDSFALREEPNDRANWALIPLRNRDTESASLDAVNADTIERELTALSIERDDERDDALNISVSCWLVGWREHLMLRLKYNDEYTPAFLKYVDLCLALENNYCLDDDMLSERELTAFDEYCDLVAKSDLSLDLDALDRLFEDWRSLISEAVGSSSPHDLCWQDVKTTLTEIIRERLKSYLSDNEPDDDLLKTKRARNKMIKSFEALSLSDALDLISGELSLSDALSYVANQV